MQSKVVTRGHSLLALASYLWRVRLFDETL